MKVLAGIKIIECENIRLGEKDLVEVKSFQDLIWLSALTLFKMGDTYYMLTSDVAYTFTKEGKEMK